MDFSDPRQRAAFFAIHSDLPREGPGNRASTLRALAIAQPLPVRPRVLDIACGPGAQTLDLAAALPDASIVAVDFHAPYLEQLRRRADEAGCADRIETAQGDMRALNFEPGAFDLIWCEGAAYIMGVPAALMAWRPLLREGGRIALTEAVWLRDDPPDEVRANWAEYPAMGAVPAVRARFEAAGYALLGDFVLPPEAWWEYYRPIEARLAMLAGRLDEDPVAAGIMAEGHAEVDCYRRRPDYFGYAFFIAGPQVAPNSKPR